MRRAGTRSNIAYSYKSHGSDACPDCGDSKGKRSKRCRSCSYVALRTRPVGKYAGRGSAWIRGLRLEDEHFGWKGDAAGVVAKHTRAIRWYPIDRPCERCGTEEKLERHHIDGDPGNNSRSNISILCRRCHMEVDGRLAASAERGRRNPPKRWGHQVAAKEPVSHCRNGHEYTLENTYLYKGARFCRACHRDSEKRRAARKQARN